MTNRSITFLNLGIAYLGCFSLTALLWLDLYFDRDYFMKFSAYSLLLVGVPAVLMVMFKNKPCKKCGASFVQKDNEDYCTQCYPELVMEEPDEQARGVHVDANAKQTIFERRLI